MKRKGGAGKGYGANLSTGVLWIYDRGKGRERSLHLSGKKDFRNDGYLEVPGGLERGKRR